MEINKGSITALVTAFGRAYHSENAEPKIFDDFLAKSMMTQETYDFIGRSMAGSVSFFDPEYAASEPNEADALSFVMKAQTTPISLSRARYTEDCLESAVAEGCTQYVILGAGMDTFVYRKPELAGKLKVYELDRSSTQEYKRTRLKELGWEIPEQLLMLSVDFTKDNLAAALLNAGYDSGNAGFFNWLGVTYYLEREDMLSVLKRITEIAAPGSLIIFDYLDKDAFDDTKASKRVRKTFEIVKNAGEPMLTGFDPAELQEVLAGIGLQVVEDMDPGMIQRRYFEGRTDGYSAFEHFHIAKVKVM